MTTAIELSTTALLVAAGADAAAAITVLLLDFTSGPFKEVLFAAAAGAPGAAAGRAAVASDELGAAFTRGGCIVPD